MNKKIVLGITSGIAAHKTLQLIKLLQAQNHSVTVIATKNAAKMVDMATLTKITGNKVYTSLFENDFDYKKILKTRIVDHIQIADSARIVVIVPATANTIAKLAYGIADDFLTTTVLATTAPVIIFPSMNVHMWEHPATQHNIKILKSYGHSVIDPDSGPLACGYAGKGRLPDVVAIKNEILKQLSSGESLKGKKMLVTAGGTIEPIDIVRNITNKSSGKMGVAITEELIRRGAQVLLLRSKTAVASRGHEEVFETADELEILIKKHTKDYDVIFHTAAVSDFSTQKNVDKLSSDKTHVLSLTPRQKILDKIKKWNPHIVLIAFKAEAAASDKQLLLAAKERLVSSGADVIVANDISRKDRGFDADTNEVIVVFRDGKTHTLSLAAKPEIANKLITLLLDRQMV